MGLRKMFKKYSRKVPILLSANSKINLELHRLSNYPRFKEGITYIFGKPFKFHDGASFVATYKELFMDKIYQFNPSGRAQTILDCGANMGLSVLYFAQNYPHHQIIAFEPDEAIFKILQENVNTFLLKNVKLYKKGVWTRAEDLPFFTDGGMGGRINEEYSDQKPVIIETVPLLDFLTEDVDFLKLDIEGAEDEVLRYCGSELSKAQHIFFEYHNNIHKRQTLHELLDMLQKLGFHYYIKESGTLQRPFVDQGLICESFDMALNIFCYKTANTSID